MRIIKRASQDWSVHLLDQPFHFFDGEFDFLCYFVADSYFFKDFCAVDLKVVIDPRDIKNERFVDEVQSSCGNRSLTPIDLVVDGEGGAEILIDIFDVDEGKDLDEVIKEVFSFVEEDYFDVLSSRFEITWNANGLSGYEILDFLMQDNSLEKKLA